MNPKPTLFLVFLLFVNLLSCVFGQTTTYNITTIAGGGTGEGGPASTAFLYTPNSVAFGLKGELYIADDYRIRKIENNTITTIVGSASKGFSGDGGLSTLAKVQNPTGIVVGTRGEILFVDSDRIRKIENGIITTIAGTGDSRFGGDGDLATKAQLNSPRGIAISSTGEIYIADTYNHRIRRIALNGTINTVAGTGDSRFGGDGDLATKAQLNYPMGIAISSTGEIYIADTFNERIRRIALNGTINTIAGTGVLGLSGDGDLATKAQLNTPRGIAISSTGEIYFADTSNQRIRRIALNGIIDTIAGTGDPRFGGDGDLATKAQLNSPRGIAISSTGEIYIADTYNQRIRRIALNTNISTFAGSGFGYSGYVGDGGLSTDALLNTPLSVACSSNGEIYIADTYNHRIRKISLNNTITTIAGTGDSGFSGDGGLAINARLSSPADIVVNSNGVIYFSDYDNNRIRKIASNGIITTVVGSGVIGSGGDGGLAINAQLNRPYGITFNSNAEMYIVERMGSRIRKVGVNGIITTVAGSDIASGGTTSVGSLATKTVLNAPSKIVINSNNEIIFSDSLHGRVLKIGLDGIISGVGNSFRMPIGIAIGSDGEMYIADTSIFAILKIDKKGVLSTIVTGLESPRGITLDSKGNIYVTDLYVIHKITPGQQPSPYKSTQPDTSMKPTQPDTSMKPTPGISSKPTPGISSKPTPGLSLKPAQSMNVPTPKNSERVSEALSVVSGWLFTFIIFISVFQF
ncbi:predicted protein [Naegleria gruberi]|uniref:Predicted protein n=1 Tax=Naegleria gruberi TaxID=5762 RepID=D2W304_NAEGR|nr:uncharacterized protein NAEGRDRAFT_82189 [Naegleria gruberi]EFC36497.1 predicted protein [Naegleria gruberi]|eukprot:XP_002669241.1 predicted protein [Naegleria gruberi strain NEG-M]